MASGTPVRIFSVLIIYCVVGSAESMVNRTNLEMTLRMAFTTERSPVAEGQKTFVRNFIKKFFTDLDSGSDANLHLQNFHVYSPFLSKTLDGMNVIWTLPGERHGTPQDALFIVGAHYDTVIGSPGVDDNGSGAAVMLEIARATAAATDCSRKNSIIFVAFDLEEAYNYEICHGSKAFVDDYLVKDVLQKYNIAPSRVKGGVVFDTIMNYDETPGTQRLPQGMDQFYPEKVKNIIDNRNKSDQIIMVGRRDEANITNDFLSNWNKTLTKGPLDFTLPIIGQPSANAYGAYFGDLYRSDHFRFWNSSVAGIANIPVLFFTDSANFRGYMGACYHHPCDSIAYLTDKRLEFMQETAESIAKMAQKYACDIERQVSGSPTLITQPVLMLSLSVILLSTIF